MPLFPQLYSREQVFVSGRYAFELKRMEKNILRFTNSGGPQDRLALLAFCRDMYAELERERLDLLAREEAWRREWGGKKGQVKALFDAIDTDGSGVIDIDELSQALQQMPDFFGYSETGGDGGTPEGMQEWLKDEVAGAAGGSGVIDLFKRLDADGDGKVNWEEFWTVIGEWMETGFNRLEELRKREGQLKEERERALAEEATRHTAEEERKRREAEESLQKDMEEEQRKAELAAMDEADKAAAQKKK